MNDLMSSLIAFATVICLVTVSGSGCPGVATTAIEVFISLMGCLSFSLVQGVNY